ncbi:MAG: DUF123 domain-containing protein [Nitrospiria bacterium]
MEGNKKWETSWKGRREGLYHLVINLKWEQFLAVGALGPRRFPVGTYIYTGSAKRGLVSRIQRHLRREKKRRWHIDYLTVVAPVCAVWVDLTQKVTECERHRIVLERTGARVLIPKFGSSDCRCQSHLAYFPTRPELQSIKELKQIFPVSRS